MTDLSVNKTLALKNEVPLHHVWSYTKADREFWSRHLECWVPAQIIDAHVHIFRETDRVVAMTDKMRRQYWVNELYEPIDADVTAKCDELVFPQRQVNHVGFGWPSLEFDLEKANAYLQRDCLARGWHCLALLRPQWSSERVVEELSKPGVIGLKPYYALINFNPATRDEHLEASIFDFVTPQALEAANAYGSWITLHVPKADRLAHRDNIREIKQIREQYPNVRLVIAHLGRCYTLPHAEAALPHFKNDDHLYFDTSAVLNPDVFRFALETLGPRRVLFGTDNPVFYMRGRRRWEGMNYINHTNYPFHFNTDRETPEIEANYTLYMYEAMRALRRACEDLKLSNRDVQMIFHDNAQRVIDHGFACKPAINIEK